MTRSAKALLLVLAAALALVLGGCCKPADDYADMRVGINDELSEINRYITIRYKTGTLTVDTRDDVIVKQIEAGTSEFTLQVVKTYSAEDKITNTGEIEIRSYAERGGEVYIRVTYAILCRPPGSQPSDP